MKYVMSVLAGMLAALMLLWIAFGFMMPVALDVEYIGEEKYQFGTVSENEFEVNIRTLFGKSRKTDAFNLSTTELNDSVNVIGIEACFDGYRIKGLDTQYELEVVPLSSFDVAYVAADVREGDAFNKECVSAKIIFADGKVSKLNENDISCVGPEIFSGGENIISVSSPYGAQVCKVSAVPISRIEHKSVDPLTTKNTPDYSRASYSIVYEDGTERECSFHDFAPIDTLPSKLSAGDNIVKVEYKDNEYDLVIHAEKSSLSEKQRIATKYVDDTEYDSFHGRLHINSAGIDVALYTGASQESLDRWDSACIFQSHNNSATTIIGDHCNQEFKTLQDVKVGDTAYIDTADGRKVEMKCIGVLNGYNEVTVLTDENHLSLEGSADVLMYTNIEDSDMVRICQWESASRD